MKDTKYIEKIIITFLQNRKYCTLNEKDLINSIMTIYPYENIKDIIAKLNDNFENLKKYRKDSIETSFDPEADIKEWSNYKTELQKVLNLYLKKYPDANNVAKFGLVEGANLQHYKPDTGYYSWHSERQGISDRHLVFMTYLNDVDEGGTEFKNQKIKLPAKKGLTTIWPTDWTHTHRGVISKTQDKYIITGWFNYV